MDCGGSFPPECMDFDHIDPKAKSFTISNAVVSCAVSWTVVAQEIVKCRLICANCHRIRTAIQNRRGQPSPDRVKFQNAGGIVHQPMK